jgi:hypothetical protein
MGLVEGLAVAATENDNGREAMAALKRAGRLPDLNLLFSPSGFYAEGGARAYAAAGDFVRWIMETRGVAPIRQAYADGDLDGALGQPVGEVIAAYVRALDAVPVDPLTARALAEQLDERPLFLRTCGRVQAERRAAAAAATEARNDDLAATLYARMERDDPADLAASLGRLEALRRRDGWNSAAWRALHSELLSRSTLGVDARLKLLEQGAEGHVRAAEMPAAAHDLDDASALATREEDQRRLALKRLLLDRPDALLVFSAMAPDTANTHALLILAEAAQGAPKDGLIAYLYARRLGLNDEWTRALAALSVALADASLPHLVRLEALRLQLEWLIRLRERPRFWTATRALLAESASASEKRKAKVLESRAQFYLAHETW